MSVLTSNPSLVIFRVFYLPFCYCLFFYVTGVFFYDDGDKYRLYMSKDFGL